MGWMGKIVSKRDSIQSIIKSVGLFSLIEGAILFSSFAFLKHFNSSGKNKLSNLNAGINFSINDENIHSQAGAWLHNTLVNEAKLPEEIMISLRAELVDSATKILLHESKIIDLIYEKGEIDGLKKEDLYDFVASRLNICLKALGITPVFKTRDDNPILSWFYKDLASSVLHDFFVSTGNDYSRNWTKTNFIW